MKILILGASGSVGEPLFRMLSPKHDVFGTYNQNKPEEAQEGRWLKWDCSDTAGLDGILDTVSPDVVVSSFSGDFAEQLEAYGHLANRLRESSQIMVFISTANVFDGDARGDCFEGIPPYPISPYGKFKQNCEELLRDGIGDRLLVVRLPKIINAKSVQALLKQAENAEAAIYSNLYMSLNSAENVACAISHFIENQKRGIVHLTSNDSISVDESIDILLAKIGKTKGYSPQLLDKETYCKLLHCDDISLLRISDADSFRLTLKSFDADILSSFNISCREVLDGVEL